MPDVLPNDPAARSPTGEILNQASTPTQTPTEPNNGSPTQPAANGAPASLARDGEAPSIDGNQQPTGAPESYTPFTAPEGRALDEALVGAATPIFRELGLSQAAAQRLVDFWNERTGGQAEALKAQVETMREGWRNEVKSDPTIGPKLDAIKADIGRALDRATADRKLDAATRAAFIADMDMTGAGDKLAFIKVFSALAQYAVEGQHVTPGNPSPNGQSPGPKPRPSLAEAMYPALAQNRQ